MPHTIPNGRTLPTSTNRSKKGVELSAKAQSEAKTRTDTAEAEKVRKAAEVSRQKATNVSLQTAFDDATRATTRGPLGTWAGERKYSNVGTSTARQQEGRY